MTTITNDTGGEIILRSMYSRLAIREGTHTYGGVRVYTNGEIAWNVGKIDFGVAPLPTGCVLAIEEPSVLRLDDRGYYRYTDTKATIRSI